MVTAASSGPLKGKPARAILYKKSTWIILSVFDELLVSVHPEMRIFV
jgi:hypothetical protein